MSEDFDAYKRHFDEILGPNSTAAYVEGLRKVSQIVYRGGVYGHEDMQSELINIINGRRTVRGAQHGAKKRLHVYGRCGAFGYAVEDAGTIPSALQRCFNEAGLSVQVVNHGLWGADDELIINNLIVESRDYTEDDAVVIYERGVARDEEIAYEKLGVRCFRCTEALHEDAHSAYCFYDRPGHMSAEGYEIIARFIFDRLGASELSPGAYAPGAPLPETDYAAAFMNRKKQDHFTENLESYLREIRESCPLSEDEKMVGAIVMNCNPFTLGHRYLIEYAAQRVDRLYVFVLQEDKSFFRFEDRLMLAKQGTRELANVIVLPSREFMISALTFPEYFMKEYKESKDFDATQDLYTFGHFIAPALHISIRFAGQEPADVVTRTYNEHMRTLLPQMGVAFCEIPRKTLDDGQIVSASTVRELMRQGRWAEIAGYVPETTLAFLNAKYRDAAE